MLTAPPARTAAIDLRKSFGKDRQGPLTDGSAKPAVILTMQDPGPAWDAEIINHNWFLKVGQRTLQRLSHFFCVALAGDCP
jgi:hypothetical protein